MPWFQHRDGGRVKSGTMTFGPGHPRVEIRDADGVFWAPPAVAGNVEAAGHTPLDHAGDQDDPPPVQDTAGMTADTSTPEGAQAEGEGAETTSEPPDGDAPTRDEIEAANRNQAWSLVKEADPDNHLGLEYAGEGAAGAKEMRAALLEHYGYESADTDDGEGS